MPVGSQLEPHAFEPDCRGVAGPAPERARLLFEPGEFAVGARRVMVEEHETPDFRAACKGDGMRKA